MLVMTHTENMVLQNIDPLRFRTSHIAALTCPSTNAENMITGAAIIKVGGFSPERVDGVLRLSSVSTGHDV